MQHLTPNVEEQLLRLSARVSLGTARGPELLRVASDVLATDIALPAAVELASKYSDITIAEAEPLLRRLLDEPDSAFLMAEPTTTCCPQWARVAPA